MNWRLVAARLTRSQGVMRPEADSCRVAQHRHEAVSDPGGTVSLNRANDDDFGCGQSVRR